MSERWHKQREDPLIRARSSPHQFRYVKIWSVSFSTDTHSDKTALWRESKANFRLQWKLFDIETSALASALFLRSELSVIMKYWLKKLMKESVPMTDIYSSLLQQILYINMSYSYIMWSYYRQYIAMWGMVGLLINVFDRVSHYCHHMWSSTWVMRFSFYMGIKERSIHCAP